MKNGEEMGGWGGILAMIDVIANISDTPRQTGQGEDADVVSRISVSLSVSEGSSLKPVDIR